jgi:hypothetical protein
MQIWLAIPVSVLAVNEKTENYPGEKIECLKMRITRNHEHDVPQESGDCKMNLRTFD